MGPSLFREYIFVVFHLTFLKLRGDIYTKVLSFFDNWVRSYEAFFSEAQALRTLSYLMYYNFVISVGNTRMLWFD